MKDYNFPFMSQKGFGFFSLMIVLPAVLFILLLGMKSYPILLEKIKVDQIMSSAESKSFEAGMNVKKLALFLETQFQLDGVNQLRRKAIEKLLSVKKTNFGKEYTLNYLIKVDLFENLSLVYNYKNSITIQ